MAGLRCYLTAAQLRAESPPLGDDGATFFFAADTGFIYTFDYTATSADNGTTILAPTKPPTTRGRYVTSTTLSGDFAEVRAALAAATSAVDFNAQKITGVADPAAAQDAATKAYVDSLAPVPTTRTLTATSPITGGGTLAADRAFAFDDTGFVKVVSIPITSAATAASTLVLSTSMIVLRVRVKITGVAFTASTTLNVGHTGHTTDYAAASGDPILSDLSLLGTNGLYDVEQRTAVGFALPVLCSVGGASVGTGVVQVMFVVPYT